MNASWQIEAEIDQVERSLLRLKDELASWSDAATEISLAAADRRASNAERGRGLGGMLFGAKYRAAARRSAASSNAAIAREVAGKRRTIADAKQALRETERELRWRLRDLKADLRDARAREREDDQRARSEARSRTSPPKAARVTPKAVPVPVPIPTEAISVKDELRRLKDLHACGKLDAIAYERARIALLTPHLPD